MGNHTDLEAELRLEQAHIDHAYRRLDDMRALAEQMLRSVLDQGRGGTFQFREERDVIVRTSLARLAQLDIGEQALCFGRIDRAGGEGVDGAEAGLEKLHIGRLGVSSEDLDPLVVDWRAPVAEPFYRATGRDPMGLVLRRHLGCRGRQVVGIEDERFVALEGDTEEVELGGPGALLAALEGARTGFMRDIVATIQKEQDEIIRAPMAGILIVQGGPGTGKTAVALHRAAYLLYTHRFPLERQGVLVVGPNPLFLRYIEQVLPSLGESGVTLSTIEGLVGQVRVRAEEPPELSRLKGDARMAKVISRALRSRQRPLRTVAEVPYGPYLLRLTPDQSASVVRVARRRPGTHNARRRFVEQAVIRLLVEDYRRRAGGDPSDQELGEVGRSLRRVPELRRVLDRIWPRLSAEELIHDLFGAPALIRVASSGVLSSYEAGLLFRPRSASLDDVPWTRADLALLDEARVLLGPRRRGGSAVAGSGFLAGKGASSGGGSGLDSPAVADADADEGPRSYGHIVVDEAQDLSPMQLRMIARRSLSGSVTVVGDIGQATGPWAPSSWDEVTTHLPQVRPPRSVELSVSYRTPAEVMELALPVLMEAVPTLRAPRCVRRSGMEPLVVRAVGDEPSRDIGLCDEHRRDLERDGGPLARSVATVAQEAMVRAGEGTTAVIVPSPLLAVVGKGLKATGLHAVDPRKQGLGAPLTLIPVDLVNGLEFDSVVVVEPAAIANSSSEGMRSLYVALTRPTRWLAVVHERPLPAALQGALERRGAASADCAAVDALANRGSEHGCWRDGRKFG